MNPDVTFSVKKRPITKLAVLEVACNEADVKAGEALTRIGMLPMATMFPNIWVSTLFLRRKVVNVNRKFIVCKKKFRISAPFIDQLCKLQTVGISVNHSRCNVIKLIPMLLIGDNFGLNEFGIGFVECFTANHFCRFCRSIRTKLLENGAEEC